GGLWEPAPFSLQIKHWCPLNATMFAAHCHCSPTSQHMLTTTRTPNMGSSCIPMGSGSTMLHHWLREVLSFHSMLLHLHSCLSHTVHSRCPTCSYTPRPPCCVSGPGL
ncbi:hypothetical protein NDU88_012444, partial [Pleurodeles waltl]